MFADNLKTLRRARGLSQEELAGRLHVTRQTISKWENALSVPDAELLLRLAEELEVPVSRLLGGPVEEEPAYGFAYFIYYAKENDRGIPEWYNI